MRAATERHPSRLDGQEYIACAVNNREAINSVSEPNLIERFKLVQQLIECENLSLVYYFLRLDTHSLEVITIPWEASILGVLRAPFKNAKSGLKVSLVDEEGQPLFNGENDDSYFIHDLRAKPFLDLCTEEGTYIPTSEVSKLNPYLPPKDTNPMLHRWLAWLFCHANPQPTPRFLGKNNELLREESPDWRCCGYFIHRIFDHSIQLLRDLIRNQPLAKQTTKERRGNRGKRRGWPNVTPD